MSEETEFPLVSLMRLHVNTNRKNRLDAEEAAYPIRLRQWEKQIAQELKSAQKTELDSIWVSPPVPGEEGEEWGLHMLRTLDGRARRELTSRLAQMGYRVHTESPCRNADLARLFISWG